MTPTSEQQLIIEAARKPKTNLMIKAYAGTGKTSTLVMLAQVLPPVPTLALAFSVKIKKELEARLPSFFEVKTMNGLGHVAFGRTIGKRCSVNANKLGDILKDLLKSERGLATGPDDFANILNLVRKARTMGLTPKEFPMGRGLLPDTDDAWQEVCDAAYLDWNDMLVAVARAVLKTSIGRAYKGELDFDDQIYMSSLFGGVFPRFQCVLVDEAQDLSPLNHRQVARTAADRLMVVGDPCQAIYAFRGADSSSMDSLRALRSEWCDLALSTTFRCPQAVVARQQDHAVGYRAAASAPQGEVTQLDTPWDPATVPGQSVAILCRNNAPLFSAALRLIKRRIGCTLMGAEIGKGLVTLSRKLFPSDDMSIETCLARLRDWQDGEISKAQANDKLERVAIIRDKFECLLAVVDEGSCKNARDIRTTLTAMFESTSLRFVLATGHKAKGLEWETVIHLDPWRVPSRHAKKAQAAGDNGPMQQELNLKYVIETRAKSRLILADLETMQ